MEQFIQNVAARLAAWERLGWQIDTLTIIDARVTRDVVIEWRDRHGNTLHTDVKHADFYNPLWVATGAVPPLVTLDPAYTSHVDTLHRVTVESRHIASARQRIAQRDVSFAIPETIDQIISR